MCSIETLNFNNVETAEFTGVGCAALSKNIY